MLTRRWLIDVIDFETAANGEHEPSKPDAMGSLDSTTELALRCLYEEHDDENGDLVVRYFACNNRLRLTVGHSAAQEHPQLRANSLSVPLNLDAARSLHRFLGYVLGLADKS